MVWSEGETNVRESIRVILLTEPEERLMLPEFGAGLNRFLFEPNTVTTRHLIQDSITKALNTWEPRIIVEAVSVDPEPSDPHAVLATITYKLVATQARESVGLTIRLTS
jgi:phage baseplate assembly protein W